MDNEINYPSCIKIPASNSKQNINAMLSQKFDVKDTSTVHNELLLLADRIFGEGKWTHCVTNQTIDFAESFKGNYVCGCTTFFKIQLHDGIFHEDYGYCCAEGATKGSSIQCAKIGSHLDAFKRVLSYFGKEIRTELQKLLEKLSSVQTSNNQKENSRYSLFNVDNMPPPSAQSTPFIAETVSKSKNPDVQKNGMSEKQQTTVKSKSPTIEQAELEKFDDIMDKFDDIKSDIMNDQKASNNVQKEQTVKKVLNEEELARMERKRKQMEKQAEFKRLMKENKVQLRVVENKKPKCTKN